MARKIDEQKNLETRNKIIDTSIEIILKKSFSKFTLSEVAKKLNVTKATIYWYFDSKDDLLLCISDRIWAVEVDSIQTLEKTNTSAKEKLIDLLFSDDALYACILPTKFLFEYHNEDNAVKKKIYEGWIQYLKSLVAILLEGKENGEFHFDIPEKEMASFIISAFDGMAINSFSLQEKYTAVSKHNLIVLLQSILGFE